MSSWVKPTNGFLKLNVGAVFSPEQRAAAVACVIRDVMGEFRKGSAGLIGLAPPIAAELWAVFYGLKLSWEMATGFQTKKFIVETDSSAALYTILHPDPSFPFAPLVDLINALLHESWESLELNLISDEANRVANNLATHNLAGTEGVEVLDAAPLCIKPILDSEA